MSIINFVFSLIWLFLVIYNTIEYLMFVKDRDRLNQIQFYLADRIKVLEKTVRAQQKSIRELKLELACKTLDYSGGNSCKRGDD